jgi:nicotinic acetylcholine receptor alpha-7
MGFCMSIFLTFAVFLTMMNESLPKSSDKVSYFTLYLLTQFVLSGVTVVLEAIVLMVHFHSKPLIENSQTNLKITDKRRKFKVNSVHLDRTFLLLVVAIDVFSVGYYILNVLT